MGTIAACRGIDASIFFPDDEDDNADLAKESVLGAPWRDHASNMPLACEKEGVWAVLPNGKGASFAKTKGCGEAAPPVETETQRPIVQRDYRERHQWIKVLSTPSGDGRGFSVT